MKADLDKHFPRNGPCMFHSTRYARHRVVDVIRDARRYHGTPLKKLAEDFDITIAAVKAAIRSTPDDNRMTRKEIREGKAAWTAEEEA